MFNVQPAWGIPPPQEAVYVAMAAREREEERCQRTMIDLNQTSPTHPGKSSEEVAKVIQEVRGEPLQSSSSTICVAYLLKK